MKGQTETVVAKVQEPARAAMPSVCLYRPKKWHKQKGPQNPWGPDREEGGLRVPQYNACRSCYEAALLAFPLTFWE